MAHTYDEPDIFCDRSLSPGLYSHLYFLVAIAIGVLFLIGAGISVFSAVPPSPAWLLVGAMVAFALMLFCLMRAASH